MAKVRQGVRSGLRGLATAGALAGGAYAVLVATAWIRYGHRKRSLSAEDNDALLDHFMPIYEAVERHRISVAAPAETTFAAACEQDLSNIAIVRGVFKARELIVGSEPSGRALAGGLLQETKALGWGVLAEVKGREIVMGAITQPWEPNVVFHALSPDEFAGFSEPGYVKIAWTLRADPVGPGASMFRTETRAAAVDPVSRQKFRWYWAKFSPGIWLIRRLSLAPVKREAERRARQAALGPGVVG